MKIAKDSASDIHEESAEDATFQNVVVDLHGRLMCVDFNECECVAVEMSPGEVQFKCGALPRL